MYAMFYGCGGLTSLDISGFTSRNLQRTSKMFTGVGHLETFACTDDVIMKAYRTR